MRIMLINNVDGNTTKTLIMETDEAHIRQSQLCGSEYVIVSDKQDTHIAPIDGQHYLVID